MKLSFKLLGGIFAGTVVVILAISLLSFNFTQSALEKSIGQNQLALAEQTMNQIDSLLYERYINIQANAGETFFADRLLNRRKRIGRDDLVRIKELTIVTGPWNKLFVADLKGTIVFSSDEEMIERSIGGEPGRRAGFEKAVGGEVYHSDFLQFEDTKKFAVFFAAPVRDREDPVQPVIGAVMGGFSWEAVEEILENLPASAVLVNREGKVIADSAGREGGLFLRNFKNRPFVEEVAAGRKKSMIVPGEQSLIGVDSLISYAPQRGRLSYASSGWGLIVSTPVDVALAGASRTALRLVLLLLPIFLSMGGLAMFLIWRSILKPISLLTQTTRAIRKGDMAQRAPVLSRDEIGELAVSFNRMIENLNSEKKYRAMTDSAPNAVISINSKGNVISWNPMAEKIFGYRENEMLGKPVTTIMPERFREAHGKGLGRYLETGKTVVIGKRVELAGLKKTGEEFPLELHLSAWDQESEVFFTGIIHDITERKRGGAALEASETKYRKMVDTCPDAILIADVEAKTVRYANPAACHLLGYTQEELVSRNVADLHPKEALPHVMKAIEDSSQQERTTAVEIPFLRKDGTVVVAEVSGTAATMEGRTLAIGFFRDLTERKRAEAERSMLEGQFQQAQKMESIGRLTGGVAHDFNNLLGIIIGNCELALADLNADTPAREYLKDIKEAGEHGATLTSQLLAFSRKQVLQPKVFNINDILNRADHLLRRLIGEDIRLLTVPAPDLGLVKADPNQMEQVIFNLAANARDAMPRGGRLTLETKNATLDEAYAEKHLEVRPGPYVLLAVSDTGTGMDAKTLSQLFEPFFTTKGRGKGTGLGLSMVYGIVKQSRGHISVYSEPGKGASFKIYLPRVEAGAEPTRAEKKGPTTLTGSETVMVVEDEEKLRKLICRVLREKGYAVLEAASGPDALRTVESSRETIALLITDVIMPGMSGREVAERIILKKPGIKILYISGFTENAIVHHGVLQEGTHFLAKPFTPETLLHQVREVLG